MRVFAAAAAVFLAGVSLAVQLPAQNTLHLDQAGYLPDYPKFVFTTQPADSFYISDTTMQNIFYRGAFALWRSDDPATGANVYRGDFSRFDTEGRYVVVAGANLASPPFGIGLHVYTDLYRKAQKAFYFQRCGDKLALDYAGMYARSQCHIADAFFHVSSGLSGFHAARGGWHDAGDYGKYVVNAAVTAGTLMLAYESFPGKFDGDDFDIPASGNGVPDLLDEVRYELEWLLAMQHSDGGVFHKLTSEQFSGVIMPASHTALRYIYQISTTATADFAGVMARAARVFSSFDAAFADSCLRAARKAWAFLEAHPDILPAGGFENPAGTQTGTYGDEQDWDERLWAAAELFAATGEETFHTYYKTNYSTHPLFEVEFGWPEVDGLAHLAYLRSAQAGADEAIRAKLRAALESYCNQLVARRDDSGFHVLLGPGEYVWGSNSNALNRTILLIFGYEETGNATFLEAALDQLHYVLGSNIHGMSFVTGVGQRSPRFPHHRPSAADGIAAPIPGFLVGGPNEYLQDPALQAGFNSATPPARAYLDDWNSYASNEIAINWNAPLVFVSGYFSGTGAATGLGDSRETLPGSIELRQNYPNPFADETDILFRMHAKGEVSLSIYDLLGRRIFARDLGVRPAGEYSVDWNGRDSRGNAVAPGIYFYVLRSGRTRVMKKLILSGSKIRWSSSTDL